MLVAIQQSLNRSGKAIHQRNLDEDQGFTGQGGMKETVTAPVVFQPAAQVAPVLDGMYSLVGDEFFKHRRRRIPVDLL